MGFYTERLLPRFVERSCGMAMFAPLRRRVCACLKGDVVEVGFGSGLNVPFYPAHVTHVSAVEPSDLGWRLADSRLNASQVPIERTGLDGEHLPFDDDTFDSAVLTWTLCTIPDPVAAMSELRRVLKQGGTLHFLEHGLAPDEKVRRWQRRLEPFQKRIAGGCHLTREIATLITDAGFTITDLDTFYTEVGAKSMGAQSLGRATAPA